MTMAITVPRALAKDDEEKTRLMQAFESKLEALGQEHSETLDTMHNLAFVLTCRGEHEDAEVLLRKAVPVVESVFGEDHPRTTHSMSCLTTVLRQDGKYAEAEAMLRRIADIKERSLGNGHPETLETTEDLAWILYCQGKYEKISELYPQLKVKDSDTIQMMMNDTSRLDAAEIIYRGSLELKTRFLGEEHPETLRSRSKLAGWLNGKCRRAEAETVYRQLVTLRAKVLGTDHKDTLESMNDLAIVLGEQKKFHDAEEVLRELIDLQEAARGKGHLEVLRSTSALARVLLESGRPNESEEALRQLVALKSQLHGEDHPETLESMDELAIVVSEQEKYDEAEKIFRQLTESRQKSLSSDNPKVLTTLSYLAVMLEKQGKHDEAEKTIYHQQLGSREGLDKENSEEAAGRDGVFIYQPLTSPKSTRILKIYPSRFKTAALVCELTEEELNDDNPPSYAAISYTWDQTPSRRILCHGKVFAATQNCEAIIRQFRRADKMSYLWIDAICIDQSVVKERNRQVAMMEDIYRLAEVVAVWLGPATEFTEEAFSYFEDLAEDRYSDKPTKDNLDRDRTQSLLLSKEILGQPWFTRMWTIQEVAMASPKAVYLCRGDRMMRWETFMQAMESRKLEPNISSLAHSAAQIFNRLRPLFESARASSQRPGLVSPQALLRSFTPLREILNILVEIRGKHATDVRDKVFALHGIFRAFNARFPPPDYSKPARQVFCETAKAVIEQDKSLHILYHVSSRTRMAHLPSWVPDWGGTDVIDSNPIFRFWSASRGSVHRPSPDSRDGDSLRTEGKAIGKISTRSTALSAEADPANCDIEAFQNWIRFFQRMTGSYITGESVNEAFYKSLVQLPSTEGLDIYIPNSYKEKVSPESYEKWAKVITHGMEANTTTETASDTRSQGFELISSTTTVAPVLDGAAKTFHDTIRERLCEKAFFLTDTQHMGIAGEAIQEGDVVTLLSGLEMPIILRQNEGGYSVVTWAYIHGVMEGEQWPEKDHLDTIILV
ncbi:heterokaryon incompatibility protein-domain-containing protein [Xylariaceae sp. AK1471]|nr:heterokaryon incompatibility protein-domain-containing protein [Xylariaceae sp. AK1471]